MNTLLTLMLAALLSPALSYVVPSEASQDTTADLKGVAISLERTRCEGFCPAYQVSITGDGQVRYVGHANVSRLGESYGSIDLKIVQELVAVAKEINFFSLATCDTKTIIIVDAPRLTVSVSLAGQKNTVMYIPRFCPDQKDLSRFADKLDEVVKSVKWR